MYDDEKLINSKIDSMFKGHERGLVRNAFIKLLE